jgi:hypothetical protein
MSAMPCAIFFAKYLAATTVSEDAALTANLKELRNHLNFGGAAIKKGG